MASPDSADQKLSFSGHETFVFRYFWLKKAVDAVWADPRVFAQEDAIVALGVGKNMVRSIRHWGLATGVLDEEPKSRGTVMKVTPFGEFLFGGEKTSGVDPFLEDPNSLWLLHWNLISSSERSTTWQWAFNRFPSNEFTRDGLLQSIEDESRRLNLAPPSESTLSRDIEVFVRTYLSSRGSRSVAIEDSLDCPLTELGLLEELSGASLLKIRRGPKSTLSTRVFAYCLLKFWDRVAPGLNSLAFSEVAYAQNGPGTVFKLDENSLIERLDKLEILTSGVLGYTETAGLKQLYRKDDSNHDDMALLVKHFEETNPVLVGV